MVTDPIADYLTRLRNAISAQHRVVDVPASITDASTVMPVQIFLWADSPERGFLAKTSAAILVLLGFLFLMNASAAYLRRRFESK